MEECQRVEIGIVNDENMPLRRLFLFAARASCCHTFALTLHLSIPQCQSQSTFTSHICELSTRLQTLSDAGFAAACGCGLGPTRAPCEDWF
jgi:hypothetical protein